MYYGCMEWLSTQASDLAGYVLELSRHDRSAKLPAIGARLSTVLREQGESQLALFELARLVGELKRSLLDHYAGIEGVLLLQLASSAEARGPSPSSPEIEGREGATDRSAAQGWSQALAEHPPLLALLDQIRRASFDFSLPPGTEGGDPKVKRLRDLYERLRDLEIDVRRHIYLEEQMIVPLLEKEST